MVVELISVGTELLLGNITNTNVRFLAQECAQLGLSCYYQVTVGDNADRIASVFKQALGRSDIVILSGGLGPTEGDLTKDVVADVLGRNLKEDPHTKQRIEDNFRKSMFRQIPENNWRMAQVPEGALVMDNHFGQAPGLILKTEDGKTVILLPGPPGELCPLFEEQIKPYLAKMTSQVICSKMVKVCGLAESYIAQELEDLIDHQANPTVATYAKTGEIHVRVTARAATSSEAEKLLHPVLEEIIRRLGDHIYTTEEKVTLEDVLIGMLKERNLSITTAESCTGGLLSGRMINVAGASRVIRECFVTYSNEAKQEILGVQEKTLRDHGAVSPETAEEMARGAAQAAHADMALSVTGIAGPDGGTKEKPVGLVYIGCSLLGRTEVIKCNFSGSRQRVRQLTVEKALDFGRLCLKKHER